MEELALLLSQDWELMLLIQDTREYTFNNSQVTIYSAAAFQKDI